ncbi:N-acetylglucosaminyldiphosphodolichol N-acetylglucosaminyltransferase catalytic subunit alg13 [Rhizina undulata]
MTAKFVLITVGATAPFPSLISAALSPAVLKTLASLGYRNLRIQYGASEDVFDANVSRENGTGIKVSGFDFVENLQNEIVKADLIISHAGSGSILDALRFQKRLVVVPNTQLMDNHQKELAEELEKQGYLVEGRVDNLEEAVKRAEGMLFTHFPRSGSTKFIEVLDEEMGLLSVD